MSNALIPASSHPSLHGTSSLFEPSTSFLLSRKPTSFPALQAEWCSASVSDLTQQLSRKITELKIPSSPGSLTSAPQSKPLEEQIFDSTATAKILSSQVAMHLDRARRNKIFQQLDSLHDIEEWDEDDKPINNASFETFLKAILLISPKRHPGLGLSHEGNLIAVWGTNQDRLTVVFMPKGQIRYVLSRIVDGEHERASGQITVSRLYECLKPYQPEHWFADE